MKIKVSDYIAQFFVDHDISTVFSVVGGGAMHLNNAFGQNPSLHCFYNHHEQGCSLAAEGYARIAQKPAIVCVTSGPGGTNALTGVLCAWQDSLPMLVISGQTRYATTVKSTGLNLRQFGEQEYTIIESVIPMTKYAAMIQNPQMIRYHLEKALFETSHGRMGPCWLDIPLDVQGAIVDTDNLESFEALEDQVDSASLANHIIELLNKAKRPVIIAGSTIAKTGIKESFRLLCDKLSIPTICPTSVADIFHVDNNNYFGNFGVFGGRSGNFIIQNADLILSFGARMSFKQIGFNYQLFAPKAKKICIDIDAEELKKETLQIDIPIQAPVDDIIIELLKDKYQINHPEEQWIAYCRNTKMTFPIYQEKFKRSQFVNPYHFSKILLDNLPEKSAVVVGNSCACVSVLQMGIRHKNQRLFGNVNCGTMGYDLPAAIGASIALNAPVICITGDGSIQMNLQELQTIKHYNLPIKIFVFNNAGYQAIVQTQSNFFPGQLCGCTKDTGVSFPSFEKIAFAYDFPYQKASNHVDVEYSIQWALNQEGFCICEIIQDNEQPIEPRVKSKLDSNGQLVSPPIDDLSPFLVHDEYLKYANIDF